MKLTRKIPESAAEAASDQGRNFQEPIRRRISLAIDLFNTWGDMLRSEPRLGPVVDELGMKIDGTQHAMELLEIVSTCKSCHELEGGSCCGAGIENKYEVPLLMLNLLIGVELPSERSVSGGCWFLGERGCLLRVRHVLCVNYLCSKIEKQLSREGRTMLQDATGMELDSSFVANELIVQLLIREGQGWRDS